jgi:TatD DNase family protein
MLENPESNDTISTFFQEITTEKYPFLLDIGTKSTDYLERKKLVNKALVQYCSPEVKSYVESILHFSVGIWPDADVINNPEPDLRMLEEILTVHSDSICALGECGLDRYWNKEELYKKEENLFEAQIEMAKKHDLPVIVHSRDAFQGTFDCLKNGNSSRGVIHCYSYGIEEVGKFLDLGFYISFSGTITYTKKRDMEKIKNLLQYVPSDRFLLETDAPYLAPNPKRGIKNNPLYIPYTYKYAGDILSLSTEELCKLVYKNALNLFGRS